MESFLAEVAAVITAFAALISALAWPVLVASILIVFRKGVAASLDRIPDMMNRAEKAKLGWLELELKNAAEAVKATDGGGVVSPEQIRSAAKVEIASKDLRLADLRAQIERLCTEYEAIRAAMPPGQPRTTAMDKIIAQMRTIGRAVSFMLEDLKASSSVGGRLAAIAIMQMEPDKADLEWLLARFSTENPFLFYHASLVLSSLARSEKRNQEVIDVANRALAILEAFPGVPDTNTVSVLKSITEGALQPKK